MRETKEGISIDIKVIPQSHKSGVVGWEGERLKVRIAAQPEKGRANEEVIRYFSKIFGVAKSSISIVSGQKSRNKTLIVSRISLHECSEKIEKSVLDF